MNYSPNLRAEYHYYEDLWICQARDEKNFFLGFEMRGVGEDEEDGEAVGAGFTTNGKVFTLISLAPAPTDYKHSATND
ncbi:MAG: hypothetical protein RIM23_20590 [Coleofasciculus sp. G3-WIS-01]|uniref:hypothetical protein n=1 Tax=Coleofasciculus sp. G3-WIS-01 TaxID=3069528 RepID=UPI0032F15833